MDNSEKDRILAQSRAQKQDEGMEYAENKGRKYGMMGFSLMVIILIVYNFLTGTSNYEVMSLFWAFMAAQSWGSYRVRKTRSACVTMIASAVASVGFLACHILQTARAESGDWWIRAVGIALLVAAVTIVFAFVRSRRHE